MKIVPQQEKMVLNKKFFFEESGFEFFKVNFLCLPFTKVILFIQTEFIAFLN